MATRVEYPELDYPQDSYLVDVRYYSYPEKFEVIFLNPILNKLDVKYEEPLIDIWFLNKNHRNNKFQIAQTRIDQSYKVICKPSQVPKVIAENIGGEWEEKYKSHYGVWSNREMAAEMCKCPWVFKADFSPDVYFRLRWLKKNSRSYDLSKVTYGFLDIEIDVIDRTVNLSDHYDVTQPINAITIILPHEKICALHALGPRPRNSNFIHESYFDLLDKQTKDWEWLKTHQEEFKRKIVEDDDDNKKYLKDYRIDLWLFDYKDELDMIMNVFLYIKKYRPMFMMSWNAPFDDNYILHRIERLGDDPKAYFIPDGIKTDKIYFSADKNPQAAIKTSRDWFYCSSYTTFICQERLYAGIRKSQQELRSYKLDYIGKIVAGIQKLTKSSKARFRDWAYVNYPEFLLYNVRDVVVQLAIESVCNDCQSLVSRSYMFATQFSKCFQETHIVRNIREFYYENIGYVQACRLEVDTSIDPHFKGAFVADPLLNAKTGYVLNNKYINNVIFAAADADAKAYYPSTKIGCNLDPMSLDYKCIIFNTLFTIEHHLNRSMNQQYKWFDSKNNPHEEDMSAPLINSYKNGNVMSMMYNWFECVSVTDACDFIDSRINL